MRSHPTQRQHIATRRTIYQHRNQSAQWSLSAWLLIPYIESHLPLPVEGMAQQQPHHPPSQHPGMPQQGGPAGGGGASYHQSQQQQMPPRPGMRTSTSPLLCRTAVHTICIAADLGPFLIPKNLPPVRHVNPAPPFWRALWTRAFSRDLSVGRPNAASSNSEPFISAATTATVRSPSSAVSVSARSTRVSSARCSRPDVSREPI